MALDLSKPLRHIETKGRAFVNRDGDNYVVTFLTDDEEEWDVVVWNREPSCLENIPETRELDCHAVLLACRQSNGLVGYLYADEDDAKDRDLVCMQAEAVKHVHVTYEVGEGLS